MVNYMEEFESNIMIIHQKVNVKEIKLNGGLEKKIE